MAQVDKAGATAILDDKKDGKSKVAEYLQAPRRKRKNYVFLALSNSVPAEISGSLEQFIKTNFKTLSIATPKNAEELRKSFSRQISLMVYDDEFLPLEEGLAILNEIKQKKIDAPVPIVFMTRQPGPLIEAYNRYLAPFPETDDYIYYPKVENAEILSRVRNSINQNNRRRSRRYKVDLELSYHRLSDDKFYKARLLDLSVHGGFLRDLSGRIFEAGEQLTISLPVGSGMLSKTGEYLKLACRVRRIFIIGSEVGVSFEYMTEEKSLVLTQFLTSIANEQNLRRINQMKNKASR